jgi:glucose/arabinose dehydrogenase
MVAVSILGLASLVWAFSSSPPDARTGAPGESTCLGCHSSFPLDSGNGTLTINAPTSYSPGDTLDIDIQLADPDQSRWGFEVTVLSSSDDPIGELLVTDLSRTQKSTAGTGREYIKQTNSGTDAGTPDASPGWSFQWVADGASGPVTFYAAGNAANSNFNTSGDYIYTASTTVTESVDSDGDGIDDADDNCPMIANADQLDTDSDGFGDVCDNCEFTANPGQEDSNLDGIGDACQIPQGTLAIGLEPLADGLAGPQIVTHANDGSGRLFVVEQAGRIRVIENDTLLTTPFLDLSSKMVTLGTSYDERGLLGLAFHPDYATNGRFFVRYSAPRTGDPGEPCEQSTFNPGCHTEVLAEYSVSTDPNIADPASEIIIYEADQPQWNHNGGHVAFGPDGYLYFTLGDGGGAHDGLADSPPSHGPDGNGQNIETALGTILRIDVDAGTPWVAPVDNPFVGITGLDEIFAYGFRNPFRFSFDQGGTNELVLADVGQNLFEEVNIVTNGGNYGWVIREGAHCFDPFNPNNPPVTCDTAGLIDPVAEYTHDDGLAVVGGHVYRGSAVPELEGIYLFGDFSEDFSTTGRIFYIDMDGDRSDIREVELPDDFSPFNRFVYGFGEDESGELYVTTAVSTDPTATTGEVFRIVPAGCCTLRGDVTADGSVNVQDLTFLVSFLFSGGNAPACTEHGDINGDSATNVQDLTYLVSFLFGGGAAPVPCP